MNLLTTTITALSHDCRGIAHVNGKTIFIENSLPGEEVSLRYTNKHKNYGEGIALEVLSNPSPDRVTPKCPFFHSCGGCSLQHISSAAQITYKTNILLEQLLHIGNTQPLQLMPPITGPAWNYRSRARLSVKNLHKKNKLLVGFHEKNGRFVAEIDHCLILENTIGDKISALRELVAGLSICGAIPQIEVAIGDGENMTALVFRNLSPLSSTDNEKIMQFGQMHNLQMFLQPQGIESIYPLATTTSKLSYTLPDFKVELLFHPVDFTQINKVINRQLISRVKELLDPNPSDHILDLFCGLGNFTIPLAKYAGKIVGVEGSKEMVGRAQANAQHNGIGNAEFYCADLTSELATNQMLGNWAQAKYSKIILDPPRTGAIEIIRSLRNFGAKKLIYVSCNPATFARDAKELAGQGYVLHNAGIIDMFPHTKHIETLGEFILDRKV